MSDENKINRKTKLIRSLCWIIGSVALVVLVVALLIPKQKITIGEGLGYLDPANVSAIGIVDNSTGELYKTDDAEFIADFYNSLKDQPMTANTTFVSTKEIKYVVRFYGETVKGTFNGTEYDYETFIAYYVGKYFRKSEPTSDVRVGFYNEYTGGGIFFAQYREDNYEDVISYIAESFENGKNTGLFTYVARGGTTEDTTDVDSTDPDDDWDNPFAKR